MELNRLKVILVERMKPSKWFAEVLGKNEAAVSRWCGMYLNRHLQHYQRQ